MLWLLLWGCQAQQETTLQRIWRTSRITVITENNAHCFYNYRGEFMGFEYDLARAFADYLVVDLRVITPGWEMLFEALDNRWGDFAAASITRTPEREKRVNFSLKYLTVQQHVIIHQDTNDITSIEELGGRTIHVRRNTSYQRRIEELQKKGISIDLVLHDNIPTEELIRRIADKEIEITVADTNVALLNRRYFPDVRMAFAIADEQSIAWAVRKEDQDLLREMNKFFRQIVEDGTLQRIYDQYYTAVEYFDAFDLKIYQERLQTRLPEYKNLILEEAERYGFDWRLIAAIMYQESHFDPLARSYTGVRGLMQLTRNTASEMKVKNRLDPAQSIRGGVQYLNKLYGLFDDIPATDRLWFTLASYNVGYGHVRDAQEIAAAKGLDPTKWSSLEQTLPLLRYPRYYRQTRHGYARGTEPVRYVERIRTYYDILRRHSLSDPEQAIF